MWKYAIVLLPSSSKHNAILFLKCVQLVGSPEKHSQGEQKLNKCSKFVWNTFGHAESTMIENNTKWSQFNFWSTAKKLPKRYKTLHTKHCQSIHAGAWWAAASSVMCRRVTWCCCDSYQLIYTLWFQLVGDLLDEKLDPVSVQLNTKQSKEKKNLVSSHFGPREPHLGKSIMETSAAVLG